MALKARAPHAGGKMTYLSQSGRPSWIGNMDSIALGDRENHFAQLRDRSRQEVGAVFVEQNRRMSELAEHRNRRMPGQRNAAQGEFRLFLKTILDQLYR